MGMSAWRPRHLDKGEPTTVATTFTLFGDRLSPGDPLSDAQIAQLRIIAANPNTDAETRKVVGDILTSLPVVPPSNLHPIEVELPKELADEMTVRAREALISIGDLPGSDNAYAIRTGMMDGLSAIRAAIQTMRDMGVSLDEIQRRQPPHGKSLIEISREIDSGPTRWGKMAAWFERFQHRFVKLWTRYESTKARNLALTARITELEREIKDRNDKILNRVIREAASDMALARMDKFAKHYVSIDSTTSQYVAIDGTTYTSITEAKRRSEQIASAKEIKESSLAARLGGSENRSRH
jgi:hypothetical protein